VGAKLRFDTRSNCRRAFGLLAATTVEPYVQATSKESEGVAVTVVPPTHPTGASESCRPLAPGWSVSCLHENGPIILASVFAQRARYSQFPPAGARRSGCCPDAAGAHLGRLAQRVVVTARLCIWLRPLTVLFRGCDRSRVCCAGRPVLPLSFERNAQCGGGGFRTAETHCLVFRQESKKKYITRLSASTHNGRSYAPFFFRFHPPPPLSSPPFPLIAPHQPLGAHPARTTRPRRYLPLNSPLE